MDQVGIRLIGTGDGTYGDQFGDMCDGVVGVITSQHYSAGRGWYLQHYRALAGSAATGSRYRKNAASP